MAEGLFNAIKPAPICIITKEILVLDMVILCIYFWYFVISCNLTGRVHKFTENLEATSKLYVLAR